MSIDMVNSQPHGSPFTRPVLVVIGTLYGVAFGLAVIFGGPWLAVRKVAMQAIILSLWLWAAHRLLAREADQDIPIKRPAIEPGLGIAVLITAVIITVLRYSTDMAWLRLAFYGAMFTPLAALLVLRYDRRAMGLHIGSRRGWLALLIVVLINGLIGVGAGGLLPPSELAEPPGADLAEGIGSAWDVLLLAGQLIVIAALPEELVLRVYLQPRLNHYVPLGWAILIQAVIFNALHLPQQLIRLGNPLPLALAYTVLTPANGLIAGYLWRKTRSLPLLIVLHVLAFPRFGL